MPYACVSIPFSLSCLILIISFLESLTGKTKNKRPLGKPDKVPSGLTID